MKPYSNDLAVDQVIGSAYQVVKYVAANMEALVLLSDNMLALLDMATDVSAIADAFPELTELHAHLGELLEIHDNLPVILNSSLSVAAFREAIVEVIDTTATLPTEELWDGRSVKVRALHKTLTYYTYGSAGWYDESGAKIV